MQSSRTGITGLALVAALVVAAAAGSRSESVRLADHLAVVPFVHGFFGALGGCGGALSVRPRVGRVYRGQAAYYSDRLAGRPTASGEPYRPNRLTAAHRSWPFGTKVRVTNLANQRSVVVRINDRGPCGKRKRIIDVSRRAAEALQMIKAGVVPVKVRIISVPNAD